MKTIGLIGGMSWESTLLYYQQLNEGIKQHLGGLHSAKIILYSVDFAEIEHYQANGQWDLAAQCLAEAGNRLKLAGADFLVLCTNTMHKVATAIEMETNLPLLHIADATGERIVQYGLKKIGLLGTSFTMEQPFYKDRLTNKFNLDVLTPNLNDRKIIHEIIYNELCLGKINKASKKEYQRVMSSLVQQGAEGIIFGCTEITLLVNEKDTTAKVFDTTAIHAQKAMEIALSI
ncbi:aspartate/glutamate racemase family protein [Providencia rettgeri]|uniref:Aspartate/glutamate racemase family protein n=1 Tax=Providencia rettgeri TaxID=587 RepID=A0AAP2NW17_PRORE|nr:aspartate/glutamate racemase family protein [Providencia rettgeri]MBX6955048.1 aspartate/glutamate racemase family protein [Providencia rettgeri]MBX6958870.1 aspartate/glutamate racemase family protein [Providencia rettgeri]MBX6971792.1 aspartate/glutamate racemase family protein [Providencia rettgeri]MBX6980763.1 aspartate/glutamate racemase family protein [Providencia rettgeri]MBX6984672.1 aspartate/glutamate racemase family protein [Providencia rettgeri]